MIGSFKTRGSATLRCFYSMCTLYLLLLLPSGYISTALTVRYRVLYTRDGDTLRPCSYLLHNMLFKAAWSCKLY